MGRIVYGAGLILTGITKMTGGTLLLFAGAGTSFTGLGIARMSGSSDVIQGFNEIRLGWNNDRTTQTGNYVRYTLYDGNDTIYHMSTGMAAMAGMALKPYVIPRGNPALAGGEQKDIAKKVAMGADDAAGGVGSGTGNKIPENDSIIGHIFKDGTGHIPDTPENRALLEEVANNLGKR